MKRLLFVFYTSPLAPFSGSAYRALGLLQWLLKRFQIDLVFQGDLQDLSYSFIPLDRFGQIEIVPPASSLWRKIKGFIGTLPYHHVLFSHKAMELTIRTLLRKKPYDLIWLNKSIQFPILENLETFPPVIIDQHAAEPCVWNNLIKNDPRWYAKWFFRWNKMKVLRFERRVYSKIAGAVCITQQDEEVTNKYYPGTKTICIPQGFDPNYYIPSDKLTPDLDTLLFSGTGAVRNVQAVKMMIREIMPLIHTKNDHIRLLWVGNVDRTKHPFLDCPYVETTGFVEHTPPYYDRGMIYVAPFDMGEGMKTKVIEAMAMGKVVVSTPTGVHGIDVEGLRFVKVCTSHKDFANAVLEFRKCPNIFELGKAAREYAVEHYSWDTVLAPLESFLEECMQP